MQAKDIEELELSAKETKELITPYAFHVNQTLLGLPLATPAKRALAMIIDVAFIFVAAKLSAAIIAFVAALAFYKGTAQRYVPAMSQFMRRTLKVLAAAILFCCSLYLLSVVIDFFEQPQTSADTVERSSKALTPSERATIRQFLDHIANDKQCDDDCRQTAINQLLVQIPKLNDLNVFDNNVFFLMILTTLINDESNIAASITEQHKPTAVSSQASKSVVQWSKGVIEDLGLGFGWAAIYFTLFSLLWNGQTPGKKLCNIRVVALNGEPLSLWDTFGRYGGYGAGFATGLLGFLQIFWDPNRQAIQDKISSTVVIKGSVNQTVTKQIIKSSLQH